MEDTQTRSGALATGNLLSMGIFAYYTGSNDLTISEKPNFMYNQEVKRSNASSPWTYSPVKYWPNNPGDKLTFFAYAPYVKEAILSLIHIYPRMGLSPNAAERASRCCSMLSSIKPVRCFGF